MQFNNESLETSPGIAHFLEVREMEFQQLFDKGNETMFDTLRRGVRFLEEARGADLVEQNPELAAELIDLAIPIAFCAIGIEAAKRAIRGNMAAVDD